MWAVLTEEKSGSGGSEGASPRKGDKEHERINKHGKESEMNGLIVIGMIASSIWVLVDAKTIGVKKGQLKGMADLGPWGWFWVCLLLWIVGFPVYLAKRGELKQINGK